MNSSTLPNDPAALKAVIADKEAYISQLEEQVRLFKVMLYLAKSEKVRPRLKQEQYSLFDEAETVAAEQEDGAAKDEETVEVAAHTRKKKGTAAASGRAPACGSGA